MTDMIFSRRCPQSARRKRHGDDDQEEGANREEVLKWLYWSFSNGKVIPTSTLPPTTENSNTRFLAISLGEYRIPLHEATTG
jgi:hypothetical protein